MVKEECRSTLPVSSFLEIETERSFEQRRHEVSEIHVKIKILGVVLPLAMYLLATTINILQKSLTTT